MGRLELFVAKQCPHCPRVARELRALAEANPGIELAVLDVDEAPDAARAARVQAVPTLVVNRHVRLTGSGVNVDDVALLLLDPRGLSAAALRRLVEQGNADAVAELMVRDGVVYPALVELLAEATFSIRLGAMAVAEKLIERDRAVASALADPLWARFPTADNEIRGDLVYLIGQVGAHHLLAELRAVAEGHASSDVREAAVEAIEAIEATAPSESRAG